MAKNYAKASNQATRRVDIPQTKPLNDRQVQNEAGGYVYKIHDLDYLNRFLILGSEKGSYYSSMKKLTVKSASNIVNLMQDERSGTDAVNLITDVSYSGRAPKNTPAVFALALAAVSPHKHVRNFALQNLDIVCRIPTDLFAFVHYVSTMRGWGRSLKKAVAEWYRSKTPKQLAYYVCKYVQRRVEGEKPWSHRDLLRLAHPRAVNEKMDVVFRYIVDQKDIFNWKELKDDEDLNYIWAHETAKRTEDENELVSLIKDYRLVRESIPTNMFTKKVWSSLLPTMGMTAMIRNLRNMSRAGLFDCFDETVNVVCEKLGNDELLRKARIHPLNILNALCAYDYNFLSEFPNNWFGLFGLEKNDNQDYSVNTSIVDSLVDAFYRSFENVESTGKRILVALDVSGSMGMIAHNTNITCCMIGAALTMQIARTEQNYHIMGFSKVFKSLGITASDSLGSAIQKSVKKNFGATDAAIPLKWAAEKDIKVDAFVVISDMQTWAGTKHVDQALDEYRRKVNANAKLICMGLQPTSWSIVDPDDHQSLNIVGFDAAAPRLISDFIKTGF